MKRAATSTVIFDDELDEGAGGEPLEYAGVLKATPSPEKKAKLATAKKTKKSAKKTIGMLFVYLISDLW